MQTMISNHDDVDEGDSKIVIVLIILKLMTMIIMRMRKI